MPRSNGENEREQAAVRALDRAHDAVGLRRTIEPTTEAVAVSPEEAQRAFEAMRETMERVRGERMTGALMHPNTARILGIDLANAEDEGVIVETTVLPDGTHVVTGEHVMPRTTTAQDEALPVDNPIERMEDEREAAFQLPLIPEERFIPVSMTVPLNEIDVPASTPAPMRDLTESIRLLGVFQPVALRLATVGYEVVEGRRRVLAARQAGLTHIPALVYDGSVPRQVIASMTLTGNMVRRSNPLAELEAIEALAREGFNTQQIAERLHIPMGTLLARTRLSSLHRSLRAALGRGEIAPGVAEQAARLDSARQASLAQLLAERADEPYLTARDVREVRQAVQRAVSAQLPDSLFDTPGVAPLQRLSEAQQEDPSVSVIVTPLEGGGNRYALALDDMRDQAHIAVRHPANPNEPWAIIVRPSGEIMPPTVEINGEQLAFRVGSGQVALNQYGILIARGERWIMERDLADRLHEHETRINTLENERDEARRSLAEATRALNGEPVGRDRIRILEARVVELEAALNRARDARPQNAGPYNWRRIDTDHWEIDGRMFSPVQVVDVNRIRLGTVTYVNEDAIDIHLPHDPQEGPDEESWRAVYRILHRALDSVPVGPDPSSEQFYLSLTNFLSDARARVETEAREQRTGNLGDIVVAMGGTPDPFAQTHQGIPRPSPETRTVEINGATIDERAIRDRLGERFVAVEARPRIQWTAQNIMIRGQYRMFDSESSLSGARRWFIRYFDGTGRIRKRTVGQTEWREALQLEIQRRNAGGEIPNA